MPEETTNGAASGKTSQKKKAAKKVSKPAATAKKASSKKASGARRGNKTAFILGFPDDVMPREIVDAGRKKNLDLDAAYVSSVRSKAKSKGLLGKKRSQKGNGAEGESAFRKALQGITLDRAQEIIEEIRQAYEGGVIHQGIAARSSRSIRSGRWKTSQSAGFRDEARVG